MRKALSLAFLLVLVVAISPTTAGGEKEKPPQGNAQGIEKARKVLEREYNLKPRFVEGQKRYYRLWMTIENFDDYGHVAGRSQWRGDLERVVTAVDSSGRAEEKVTWKNVGFRSWLMNEGRYGPHQAASWADGFSYTFSLEDDYKDLNWDFSEIPKNMLGFVFVGAVQISAHAEYDFLRSSHHAKIENLRRIGEVMKDLPEEGKTFDLDFPPVFTNSKLVRKNVRVGFLGLTLVNGEPCALIDYQQGPQPFTWTMTMGPPFQPKPVTVNTVLISRQSGIFVVRLTDGSLVNGQFTERTQQKITPVGGESSARSGQGMWAIREITPEEFERGLADWAEEQTPTPQFRPVLTAAAAGEKK